MFSVLLTKSSEDFFKKNLKEGMCYFLRTKKSGCAGYAYEIDYVDEQPNYFIKGVPFKIKEEDHPILNNLLIDYKKDGLNNKLFFNNPNAKHECGCGESFSI